MNIPSIRSIFINRLLFDGFYTIQEIIDSSLSNNCNIELSNGMKASLISYTNDKNEACFHDGFISFKLSQSDLEFNVFERNA